MHAPGFHMLLHHKAFIQVVSYCPRASESQAGRLCSEVIFPSFVPPFLCTTLDARILSPPTRKKPLAPRVTYMQLKRDNYIVAPLGNFCFKLPFKPRMLLQDLWPKPGWFRRRIFLFMGLTRICYLLFQIAAPEWARSNILLIQL